MLAKYAPDVLAQQEAVLSPPAPTQKFAGRNPAGALENLLKGLKFGFRPVRRVDVARPRGFDTGAVSSSGGYVYLPSSVDIVIHRHRLDCARADEIPTQETNVRLLDAKTPQAKEPHRLASVDGQRYCAVDRGTSVHRTQLPGSFL